MHELSKQFLRPSSPSGSQKSSRYKQMEDLGDICLYFQTTVFQGVKCTHQTSHNSALVHHLTTHTLSPQVEELHQIKEVQ